MEGGRKSDELIPAGVLSGMATFKLPDKKVTCDSPKFHSFIKFEGKNDGRTRMEGGA